MGSHTFGGLILILSVCFAPPGPQAPANDLPSRVVGSVYGKAVTAADVGLAMPVDNARKFDARDTREWEQMGSIASVFGGPIMERFIAERKLDATADEMAAYRRFNRTLKGQTLRETEDRLARIKQELASPLPSGEKNAGLEKEREAIEQGLPAQRDFARLDDENDGFGRGLIISWKVERELYRIYGGRLIYQQLGVEALDARRLLFEEAEKKGDLKFDDPGVRRLFYYYANMQHTFVSEKNPELLEMKPWFLEGGEEPLPAK